MRGDPSFELVGGNFTDEPYGMAIKKESGVRENRQRAVEGAEG